MLLLMDGSWEGCRRCAHPLPPSTEMRFISYLLRFTNRMDSMKNTEISSFNHNRETAFSHMGKAFHPIRNQLSKLISQFTMHSHRCWRLSNRHSQKFVEFPHFSFLPFSRKLAINHRQWRKVQTG